MKIKIIPEKIYNDSAMLSINGSLKLYAEAMCSNITDHVECTITLNNLRKQAHSRLDTELDTAIINYLQGK